MYACDNLRFSRVTVTICGAGQACHTQKLETKSAWKAELCFIVSFNVLVEGPTLNLQGCAYWTGKWEGRRISCREAKRKEALNSPEMQPASQQPGNTSGQWGIKPNSAAGAA
jgi:hypothetical protein